MEHSQPAPGIKKVLGLDSTRHSRRWRWLALGLLLAVAAGGLAAWRLTAKSQGPSFKTEAVTQGRLVVTVTATGTIQPITQVDVSSELSGILKSVSADFNNRVQAGQVLASLDTAKQEAQVLQSRAALESARAHQLQAQATLEETRLQLERIRALVPSRVVSERDLVAAEAAYKRAQASIEVARADAAKADAVLNAEQISLSKMVIRSPIAGIVLRRTAEPGQTVASSLQAPVLFTIADDLAHMQIGVAVDEADVGHVRKGQAATFSVDAYPERTFGAKVTEVRYAPQTVAGVVTYETLLAVDNRELLLRPGMTATAVVTVATLREALLIPNAALRFTPPAAQENGGQSGGLLRAILPGRRRPVADRPPANAETKGPRRVVWVLRGDRPRPIPVKIGATDGKRTQVLSGEVTPGMALLVDVAQKRP